MTIEDEENMYKGLSDLEIRETDNARMAILSSYTPKIENAQLQPRSVNLIEVAKPILGLGLIAGAVAVGVSFFSALCSVVFVFVTANAGIVAGAVAVVLAAVCLISSRSSSDARNETGPGGSQNINVVVNVNSGNGKL